MTRYKLTLEYNGTNLIGWQANKHGPSVQSLLQSAIFEFSGQHVNVWSAGRTDAGVHALGMVAHFDIFPFAGEGVAASVSEADGVVVKVSPTTIPPASAGTPSPAKGNSDTVMRALNFYLTQMNAPVAVLDCAVVGEDFHSRFSCVRRNYRYIILNRRAPVILDKDMVWHVPYDLDIDRMRAAAARLVGNHDFTSFRATQCQAKSPIKTLDEINIEECNMMCGATDMIGRYIIINVSAQSFLHHMVRNIVGTLVEIGRGRDLDIDAIFAARDRSAAGVTAPASGLYFVSAEY
ncbi:MAG: tRNA pseudouridine(38-40) synthase TruA [Rickettsiales bacterium]|jgi:tRNA pseudouridine38-40 synthase|nr:tRNA pseudouridine(38-40) synthase TruA [Rickettsiales bacterium]